MRKTRLAVLLVCATTSFWMVEKVQSKQLAQAAAFGMETGQKAPAFALNDQLGHQQTNESLQGTNGTVLLFVRSADW